MTKTTKTVQSDALDWAKGDGLVPAIIQDADDGVVLMLGYMNAEALQATLESGLVTFFSRSKGRLWQKGEESGNTLSLVDISIDCDADTILVLARAKGPTCHKGTRSCFADAQAPSVSSDFGFLGELERVIVSRKDADPKSSYTASLFAKGMKRMAQKVGEEGVEVALAAATKDREELANESADLLYHLTVLLQASDFSLGDIVKVLQERHR